MKKEGYSRRVSVPILDAIFKEMSAALARGEEVEFPLGKLKVARHKHPTQTGRFLNRKKMTIYKKPFKVVHKVSPKADRCINFVPIVLPPKPGSPPGAKRIVIDPSWALMMRRKNRIVLPPRPFFAPHPTRSVADVLRLKGK
ncbi:hypothetical protein P8935_01630 [Telmatobacter sp. DSM 110680]|uniref:Uncharacterized protein n=1 Tax=Telmatobacter sp. DSM 110680 TaxID=3036704 RepID=A0AAU7DK50_9BACT